MTNSYGNRLLSIWNDWSINSSLFEKMFITNQAIMIWYKIAALTFPDVILIKTFSAPHFIIRPNMWPKIQFLFSKFLLSSFVKNCLFSWFSRHFPYCILLWVSNPRFIYLGALHVLWLWIMWFFSCRKRKDCL